MPLLKTLQFIRKHPLNRGRGARAMLDFVKWQVATRIRGGERILQWVDGSRLSVRRGETAATGNLYCGLYECRDMAFVLHLLEVDDLFVDVGANVGSYTVLAGAVRGARCISFEPVPTTFAGLLRNVDLNGIAARVRCYNAGISDTEGTATFTVDRGCENRVLADGEIGIKTLTAPIHILDSVLKDESPTLLKVDVEGLETRVVRGACETLGKQSLLAVILEVGDGANRYGFDGREVTGLMGDHGFAPYLYDPFRRELQAIDSATQRACSGNCLFVRDADFVQARLQRAPKSAVHGTEI